MEKNIHTSQIRKCKRCCMDESDKSITLYEEKGCNHCIEYLKKWNKYERNIHKDKELETIIKQIKITQKNHQYDCVVGISGGIDSAYVALTAKEKGLRILGVHIDNGWNSQIANENISKLVNNLEIDLKTVVLNWKKFSQIQKVFLYASVPDAEMPTDHAIRTSLARVAKKNNIKYILNGRNLSTEGLLPYSWSYSAQDSCYIKSICKDFGIKNLKGYPLGSLREIFYDNFIKRISNISILNYIEYNKEKAYEVLSERFDWNHYGNKHYESRYTKFYQGYILPKKFGIDKRKAHLSVLILNNQITREQALNELEKQPLDNETINQEKEYLKKKLNISDNEFDKIMNQKIKTYKDYKNQDWIFHPKHNKKVLKILKYLKKIKLIPDHFGKNLIYK